MDCMQFEYTNRSIHGELLCQNAVPYFNAMFEQKNRSDENNRLESNKQAKMRLYTFSLIQVKING